MAYGIYQKCEFEMLAKRMVRRDGYTRERPGGSGGAFVIKKLGKCDVRVVLRDSAVSKGDMAGFERDVALSGGHGIMCTREGKVPGRCAVDFMRLSTGRFMWYVSEIGDNADAVVVFTRALYGMDERSASGASATSGGASGSATGGGASGSATSAERLKRDCQTVEIAGEDGHENGGGEDRGGEGDDGQDDNDTGRRRATAEC